MIPCVFIHIGQWEWLPTTLAQAKKYNENVVLINDSNLLDYNNNVTRFHEAYVNMSTNPQWFEERAFWRWLILSEYCWKNDIPVTFHLDTDVMMFADVNMEHERKFKQYPVSLVVGNCGATCYFTQEMLVRFSELLLRTYIDKNDDYKWLEDMYSRMQAQHLDGGACDMVMLKLFLARNQIPFGEMTDIRDGEAYDHTMREPVPGGYRMRDGMKEIVFERGIPYATIDATGQRIRMMDLHFQGDHELRIPEYVQRIKESEQ